MPDTLTDVLEAEWQNGNVSNGAHERLLTRLDTLTAAVEGLTLYDENARTMADAAESMRSRAVAILRGEQ